MSEAASARRVAARVEGVVQGVGFRPFVHSLACGLALAGWIFNDESGVTLEAEGAPAAVDAFLRLLSEQAPPLARVERVRWSELAATGASGFRILPSARGGVAGALVPPDVAPCEECLRELRDPGDRRHRYPFINCTDCGPRLSIVLAVPYDRALTTMAAFEMCRACRAEYEDPSSRRFHAQPNACPDCGPQLLLAGAGAVRRREDALSCAAELLRAGRIVAVKGVGGFHLACLACEADAVSELRRRKARGQKPFAVMAADEQALARLVSLTAAESGLVRSRERPIVLAHRLAGAPVADGVAPGLAELGVMLPSSPLHHLLLERCGAPLVMTSGNRGDEPIAHLDAAGLELLGPLADAVLTHDRPIHTPLDDSVVRVARLGGPERAVTIRRSRGHVPAALPLPAPAPALLACGAELKSTFCLAQGARAWLGPHIGDLRGWAARAAYHDGIDRMQELFGIVPRLAVHDMHPDHASSAYALEREGVRTMAVQHHHAHMAACLAEHSESGPAVAAIYDGAGLGTDGTIWGGELMSGTIAGVRRAGHLRVVRLPGGDAAARQPWRMACAWLAESALDGEVPPAIMAAGIDGGRWEQMSRLAAAGPTSPPTSSVGRLFDAVAALCGILPLAAEEGRAAAQLEAIAAPQERGAYPLPLRTGELLELDARETIAAVLSDLRGGATAAVVSARFHNALADATARGLARLAEREGIAVAVLSGGVFQNRLLLERCSALLRSAGLRVLAPERVPGGDGGISYGQAAVASLLA